MPVTVTPIENPTPDLVTDLSTRPGLVRALVLRPLDGRVGVLVTQWAEGQQPPDPGTSTFSDAEFMPAHAELEPTFAQLTWFDGPRTSAVIEAVERADRNRIWPAVRDLPTAVGALICRTPEGAQLVVSLSTSLQGLEDEQNAIMSTTLLPGEDPALLTGPDRIQIARVLAHVATLAPQPTS